MLLQLKHYLQGVPGATLTSLALHFGTSTEAMQGMLTHWERKGCVQKRQKTPKCGIQCHACRQQDTQLYVWLAGH